MRFYLLSIALNVYTPCTHFLRIQGIIITNNERPGYAFIQSKLDVFPLANWIYIWGRTREREREKRWQRKRANGERPIGQMRPATASAWAWAVTRLNWHETQRFRVVNHAPLRAESNCWMPAQHAKRERKRATQKERDRERESKQERLNRLSCWATSTCLEAYRADRQATLSTGSGNSDWFHHWKYGLTTQVRTTYTRITCVL